MMVDAQSDADSRVATAASLRTFMALPASQRSSVILMDVLGYSQEEISAITTTSVPAVKAALHRGRTYLFAGPEEQRRFLDNFDRYAPALSGYDCVKYVEQGAMLEGKRGHGIYYRGQVFLFVDEASLQQFWQAPERYVPYVVAEQPRDTTRR